MTTSPTLDTRQAADWAGAGAFDPEQVDCTTAVVLKILDYKCRMHPSEQAMVLAIYDVVKQRPASRFDESVHQVIEAARKQPDQQILETIHRLRIHAEEAIPKPIMKQFKAFLRSELLG